MTVFIEPFNIKSKEERKRELRKKIKAKKKKEKEMKKKKEEEEDDEEDEEEDKKKKKKEKKISKEEQQKIDEAKQKVKRAQDMNEIYKTYRYKRDWKYLEKHLQQWKGEPYDFIDNYYKSPDWKYYKAANKHNKLVDTINTRTYTIKEDSYVERTIAVIKEILVFFIKLILLLYVGCFLLWNNFHSVQSKDLDLDEESHSFNVDKFMNMIDVNQDQSPLIYEFVKSMYVGLAKIPRDSLHYIFCQVNKILEQLYYGVDGGALWERKSVYGRTPSQLRAVIQLLIVGVLPIGMYFVGSILAMVFMFGYLHLGYIKTTISLVKTGFFENVNYWFFKYNFTTIFSWLTVGALAHFILIPSVIGLFFVVGYITKMLQNVGKVNNVFKNITKSYMNIVLFILLLGILLIQKYNLYFHEKLPINIDTNGLIIVGIAAPFILVPMYFIYNAVFSGPATQTT